MTDHRYPVGPFSWDESADQRTRATLIAQIAEAPARMRDAVKGLTDEQLDTPYRDGGCTVRQVAHHVPDSHLNGYCRHKLALTEEQTPTIRPYDEAMWAKLPDTFSTPIDTSLTLLDSLHARWVGLWQAMKGEDFSRAFNHPDHGVRSLDWLLAMYAWHGCHHVAHVTSLRERMGW